MAGHSKWSKIKHQKAINDAKKGKTFSKIVQQITTVVRAGGGDPEANPSLRLLLDKAKEAGVPNDNVKRAINRGLGLTDDGRTIEEVTYEGFGPGGVGFIVETFTDNTNRTVSDIRKLFTDAGGNLSETGSVSWNFDHVGVVIVACGKMKEAEKFGEKASFVAEDCDSVMVELMDIDTVQDIVEAKQKEELDDGTEVDALIVITDTKDLTKTKDLVDKLGFVVLDFKLDWKVKEGKNVDGDKLEKVNDLVDNLLENPDVRMVWTEIS